VIAGITHDICAKPKRFIITNRISSAERFTFHIRVNASKGSKTNRGALMKDEVINAQVRTLLPQPWIAFPASGLTDSALAHHSFPG
jgi:hypothetical protein